MTVNFQRTTKSELKYDINNHTYKGPVKVKKTVD